MISLLIMRLLKKTVWKLWFIVAGMLCINVVAWAADGDWQQWNEEMIGQNFDYGLQGIFRAEQRWEEDVSRFSYYELEPMINWRYSPRWDFTLSYERDVRIEPESEIENMATLAALLKVPIGDWYLTNRFRQQWSVPESSDREWSAVYRNRTGLATAWRLGSKELVPFIADEWFFHIQEGRFVENRLQAGVGIPIVPHWAASIYFMRLDRSTPEGWEWHPVVGVQVVAEF